MTVNAENSPFLDGPLPRFFKALVDVGALEETHVGAFLDTDLSTGIGMLAALARLNMIHPAVDEIGTDLEEWQPTPLLSNGNASYSPDKYVVSKNNETLFDLLKERVEAEQSGFGELYYVKSDPGIGKTHLLSVLSEKANRKALLINIMDFELELERAERRKKRGEFLRWLLNAEILLLDDIHHVRNDVSLQKALRHLIAANQERMGIVIASGQLKKKEDEDFSGILGALLNSGTSFTLELPDREGRLEILKKHFGDGEIPADASQYLADNVNESVRQLMGAAGQLINLRRQTATEINRDMARAVLPLPSDLKHPTSLPPYATSMFSDGGFGSENGDRAKFFREILSTAENEEEQALALQIAIGQRLRELSDQEHADDYIAKMETALSLLRDGKLTEAIKCIGT